MCQDGVPKADILTLGRQMAGHWKNYYTDFAVHFITGTVHNWQPVLLFDEIASIFVEDMDRLSKRWETNIIGYVIMPEHFHLLIQSGHSENIMKYIRGVRRSVSGKVRNIIAYKHDKFEDYCLKNGIEISTFHSKTAGKSVFRFWKEKPRVFPLSKEDDVVKKLDYIHNNPVRRGLVNSPGEWEYASFGFYASQNTRRTKVDQRHQDVVNSILAQPGD